MTNEEAKRRIARFKETSDGTYEWDTLVNTDDLKAFEMAINALEQRYQIVKDELGNEVLKPINEQEKVGHWIKTPQAVMGEGYMWYCDKCEHQVYQDSSRPYPSENYCPNCGARMGSEEV